MSPVKYLIWQKRGIAILFYGLLNLPLDSIAQHRISGKFLFGNNSQPVSIPIAMRLYRDTTLCQLSASDQTGSFTFSGLAAGPYRIEVVSQIYQTSPQNVTLIQSIESLIIPLAEKPGQLEEVIVKGKQMEIEVRPDRVILPIESNPLFNGQRLIDVLVYAPQAQLDFMSRKLSVNGSPITQLYLNDRQIQLGPDGLSDYLQNLQAGAYSRVEIVTAPSARYESSGGAILLLYTKRPPGDGTLTDGQYSIGYGQFLKGSINLSSNWKKRKTSGFFILSPSRTNTFYQYTGWQELPLGGYASTGQTRRLKSNTLLMQTGFDFQLRPKTQLGMLVTLTPSDELETPVGEATSRLTGQATLAQTKSETFNDRHRLSGSVNLNFCHSFASNLQWSIDLDGASYSDYNQTGAAFYGSSHQPAGDVLRITYPTKTGIATAKTDMSKTVGTVKWDWGAKYSQIQMGNIPRQDKLSGYFKTIANQLTQEYAYNERTAGLYTSAQFKWNNWVINSGLRLESTWYAGETRNQSGKQEAVDKKYTFLFPSLTLSRSLKKDMPLTLSYNRRIVRPGFEALNPAYLVLDGVTYYRGNPLLQPMLSSSVQAVLVLPNRISFTLAFQEFTNRHTQVLYRNDPSTATILNTYINVDAETRGQLSLIIPRQLTKQWQITLATSGYLMKFYSSFGGENFRTSQPFATFRLTNNLMLPKWSASLSVVGRTKGVSAYLQFRPIVYADAGLTRTLTNNRSLRFALTDLFHSVRTINYGNSLNGGMVGFNHRFESRVFTFTYSHKFGNRKVSAFSRRAYGSETEQERAR